MYEIGKGDKAAFEFKLEGEDEVYSVPTLDSLPMRWVKRIRDSRGQDAASMEFFLDLFEEYAPGVVERIDLGDFKALYAAWGKASEVTPGK